MNFSVVSMRRIFFVATHQTHLTHVNFPIVSSNAFRVLKLACERNVLEMFLQLNYVFCMLS